MQTLQTVLPTSEQLPILTDDGAGFRIIRGAAGSGKTTSALLRLRQLCDSRIARNTRLGRDERVRALVLTFNRTLRGYVMQLATEQIATPDKLHLIVETFASWAMGLVGRQDVIEHQPLISKLLQKIGITTHLEYFIDEVEYILGQFLPGELESYLEATRFGRGRSPVINRNMRVRLLNEVIAPYKKRKLRTNEVDWNGIALGAANVMNQGYDVVIIDECQDLSANQLRAVLAHLKQDHSTTFIIDTVQRIYPHAFRWQDIGIEIRPHMVFPLKSNHRNTIEIARFASPLVHNLPSEEDGISPDAKTCQRTGNRPKVIAGAYSAQIDYMLNCIQPFLEAGGTVAILQPKGGGWFNFARQALQRRNIHYCELTRIRDWPTGTEQVALSTIHSAKGLEFDHVLLPGLNQEVMPHGNEEHDGTLESLRRLVTMGIGRARHNVMIGYKPGEQSTLTDFLDPETYDLVEV